jgi:hypothetical protein
MALLFYIEALGLDKVTSLPRPEAGRPVGILHHP